MIQSNSWTESVPEGLSTDFYRDFALTHARLANKLGSQLVRLIREDRLAELCAFELDYNEQGTPTEFYHARQALAFITKLEYLDIGIDKEQAALSTFLDSEMLCRETNECFSAWARGEFKFSPRVDAVLSDASRKIALVLGPVPQLSELGLRFGPGATSLTKKRYATSRRKLHDGLACSEDLLEILPKVLLEVPGWINSLSGYPFHDGGPLHIEGDCSILRDEYYPSVEVYGDALSAHVHSRAELSVVLDDETLAFVPKNAKTKRAVSTPPPLNSMVQLGYGDYMARRLRRFGIDLTDQSQNQRLAKEGSLTGDLATLDLSSASDTVSYELVHHLLPLDWAIALSECRCTYVKYKGERRRVEKFSSMGNGNTFPLESLIFWALARACSKDADVVSVYGDDIIMRTENTDLYREVLVACGFKLNLKKSYTSGPFRESCGSDWYRGFNIRPYYAKKALSGEVLFSLHNYYVRSGQIERSKEVLDLIPDNMRLFGPDGLGDGVLLGTWVPGKRKSYQDRSGYSGSLVKMHKHTGLREDEASSHADMGHALYTVYRRALEKFWAPPAGVLWDCYKNRFHAQGRNFLHYQFLVKQGTPSEPIPFCKTEGKRDVKAASLPGTSGSQRVLTYTL